MIEDQIERSQIQMSKWGPDPSQRTPFLNETMRNLSLMGSTQSKWMQNSKQFNKMKLRTKKKKLDPQMLQTMGQTFHIGINGSPGITPVNVDNS